MGTDIIAKNYLALLKEDIPEGRDDLIKTSKRLEEVAEHCLTTYNNSLEQTVNFTAQALGSVAYKINLLASTFLEVLDQQNLKLNNLQTKVNHLNMQVQIHQEKTARLSIGKYTLPRDPNALRPSKNVEPIMEINDRYKRREIDFTILDSVGHGVKEPTIAGSVISNNVSRRSSASGSDAHSTNYGYGTGRVQTIGRSSGIGMNPHNSMTGGGGSAIYRAPGGSNMMQTNKQSGSIPPPPQKFQYNSLGSRGQQMRQQQQQQQQYQTPTGLISPQHVPAPPVPPPMPSNQPPPSQYGYTSSYPVAPVDQNQQIRYSNLPPPPMEPQNSYHHQVQQRSQQSPASPPPVQIQQPQQQHASPPPPVADLPPPPSAIDPYATGNNNSANYSPDQSLNISHLQPTVNDVMRSKNATDPVWAPNSYICKVLTIYEYQRNKDDELSFDENQLIYVVRKNNDGWWEGIMSNSTGLFPGNYVQTMN